MADPKDPPKPALPTDPKAVREARLAAALRTNLRRRKAKTSPEPAKDPD